MSVTEQSAFPKPESIGRYQIETCIGQGAMGVVYKAYDPVIKRYVAIKTIHSGLLVGDMRGELLSRFSTEAEASGRLAHPNIVSIYDFGDYHGAPYFVMEFVEGVELKSLMLESDRMPFASAVTIIQGVLEGLSYVHRLGVVHRDIKPANIFVLQEGGIKIADFGIARLDDSDLTQVGSMLGTPSYMSPEQCKGAVLDSRSDLFSLAILFFEMITGQKAFLGGSIQETMHRVVHYHCQIPEQLLAHLPKGVELFFEKALAKSPQDRFQNADEFKLALSKMAYPESQPNNRYAYNRCSKMVMAIAAAVLSVLVGYLMVQIGQMLEVRHSLLNTGLSSKLSMDNMPEPPTIHADSTQLLERSVTDDEKIARLLRVARAHLLVKRLVAPQGSNAYDAYHLVLTMDPFNEDALKGLLQIELELLERIVALRKEGKESEANAVLALGQKLFPKSERW